MKTPRSTVLIMAFLMLANTMAAQNGDLPLYQGADISWVENDEAWGVQYFHDGKPGDILDILKDHGFNLIRLRLFVDPRSPQPNAGVPPGYAHGLAIPPSRRGPANGLERTLAFAKRVKAKGMALLLDFHYSDTWADPGAQYKPYAWRDLSQVELEAKIADYTYSTLQQFINQGAGPDLVQVGNEITNGFLWGGPGEATGHSGSPNQFKALLRSAIAAVRRLDPTIQIAIHTTADDAASWFRTLEQGGMDYDIAGVSWYPRWHGTIADLKNRLVNLTLAIRKPIIILEYQKEKPGVAQTLAGLPKNRIMGAILWEPINWTDSISAENVFDWKDNPRGFHGNVLLEWYRENAH